MMRGGVKVGQGNCKNGGYMWLGFNILSLEILALKKYSTLLSIKHSLPVSFKCIEMLSASCSQLGLTTVTI